jgi:hypothetical protein
MQHVQHLSLESLVKMDHFQKEPPPNLKGTTMLTVFRDFFSQMIPHARVIFFWKNQNEKGPPSGTTAAPHQMSAASIWGTGTDSAD